MPDLFGPEPLFGPITDGSLVVKRGDRLVCTNCEGTDEGSPGEVNHQIVIGKWHKDGCLAGDPPADQ